jgi:hypothetical protein
LLNAYNPDFYNAATNVYIETKGILRAQDRLKLQQVVKMNPSYQFMLVPQLTSATNPVELQTLLNERNNYIQSGVMNSSHLTECTKRILILLTNIAPPCTKRTTLSGITLLRWALKHDRLMIEGFVPPKRK